MGLEVVVVVGVGLGFLAFRLKSNFGSRTLKYIEYNKKYSFLGIFFFEFRIDVIVNKCLYEV